MADVTVALEWEGEGLRFSGGAPEGPQGRVDGNGQAAPSPMQTLLLALAGCTASDVAEILSRMRLPMAGLSVRVEGDRVTHPPRRYQRIKLSYTVRGVAATDEDKVRRAVTLSHEKYCSVLHTLRADLDVVHELTLAD